MEQICVTEDILLNLVMRKDQVIHVQCEEEKQIYLDEDLMKAKF